MDNMKLLTWNSCSLNLGCPDISSHARRARPDVMFVQEAFHGHGSCEIRGYKKYTHDTNHGLVTYFKNSFPHTLKEYSKKRDNNEGNSYMLFESSMNGNPVYLCNTYIQGGKFDETRLPNPSEFGNIIYAGDFNARHHSLADQRKDQDNYNGRRLVEFMDDNELTDLGPGEPTHQKGGRLDYIIYGGFPKAEFSDLEFHDLGSDHDALECTVSMRKKK